MRIATWNVNGLRARLDYVKLWLEAREPDVVGFQELKMEDDKFPHDAFEALGYRCVAHGQKSWNGVAILSRLPIEHLESGLPGQDEFGARLIRARVGDGDAALDFTTVYCPNGKDVDHEDFPRKLAWLDALLNHLEERCDPQRRSGLSRVHGAVALRSTCQAPESGQAHLERAAEAVRAGPARLTAALDTNVR